MPWSSFIQKISAAPGGHRQTKGSESKLKLKKWYDKMFQLMVQIRKGALLAFPFVNGNKIGENWSSVTFENESLL
jgi:hypothetical protein